MNYRGREGYMSDCILTNNNYEIQDSDCLSDYKFEKLKESFI